IGAGANSGPVPGILDLLPASLSCDSLRGQCRADGGGFLDELADTVIRTTPPRLRGRLAGMMRLRPGPLDAIEAQRIALIKPSAVGDIVHCLPLLNATRARFPKAHISWVVNAGYAPLLEGHPDLDEVVLFDRTAFRTGVGAGTQVLARFLT